MPSPFPFSSSSLLTEMILQETPLHTSDASTDTVTARILWFGGQSTLGSAENSYKTVYPGSGRAGWLALALLTTDIISANIISTDIRATARSLCDRIA